MGEVVIDDESVSPAASALDQLGLAQHSVVTRDQLRAAGMTDGRIDRQLRSGRLIRIAPRTYRPWGASRTWLMRAQAAISSTAGPAVISGLGAAYLHGLRPLAPGTIELSVPRHRRPRPRAGVRVRETTAFDLTGEVVCERLPVTGVARTILDCCAVLSSPSDRLDLLDEARRLGLVTWDELWECLFRHAGQGRRGLVRYRTMLLERDGETPPDSVFVRRLATLLEAAGIFVPAFDFPVLGGRYRIDAAWPALRVGVECDGKVGHRHEKAFESDAVRRNRLRLEGWLIIEVTWKRLFNDPAGVVADVKAALASRAAA